MLVGNEHDFSECSFTIMSFACENLETMKSKE